MGESMKWIEADGVARSFVPRLAVPVALDPGAGLQRRGEVHSYVQRIQRDLHNEQAFYKNAISTLNAPNPQPSHEEFPPMQYDGPRADRWFHRSTFTRAPYPHYPLGEPYSDQLYVP